VSSRWKLTATACCVILVWMTRPTASAAFVRQESPPPRGAEPAPKTDCTTVGCHADVGSAPVVHAPVAAGRCEICHTAVAGSTPFESGSRHEFARVSDEEGQCYSCHEPLDTEAHVHDPVRQELCILCHDPHGAPRRFLLRVENDEALCLQCHRIDLHSEDGVHGPVSAGACGACHDPHQGSDRYRLRGKGDERCGLCHITDVRGIDAAARVHAPVEQDCARCHEPHHGPRPFRLVTEPPELCLDCHSEIASQIQASAVVHQPVAEGRCLDCHDQHASDFSRLLRGRFTEHLYEPFQLDHYQLCYRCHDPEQVTRPKTTEATNFRNGDDNLHFKHVNQVGKGRSCNVCHVPHASENPALTRSAAPFGIWQVPIGLVRTETGGSCATGCHASRSYDRDQPVENP